MDNIIEQIVEEYDLKVEAYEAIDLQDDVNEIEQELSNFTIEDMNIF